MAWTTTTDLGRYESAAGAFARSRTCEHTTLLSIAERLRHQGATAFGDGAPEFGWWTQHDGTVTAAFVRTPPRPLLLTRLPQTAVRPLAETYAAHDPALPGAVGPVPSVHTFAEAWRSATGAAVTPHRSERLYRLGRLVPPGAVRGGCGRVAGPADRQLLTGWYGDFARAIGEPDPYRPRDWVDDRLSHGGLTLWQHEGRPVAFAGSTRDVGGTVRIGPVYTPRPLRGRGYASAVTAQACRQALAAGSRELVLFADLANPTSNALYQRLGFRTVSDYGTVGFTASR